MRVVLFLISILFFQTAYGINLDNLGDFSSRSIIIQPNGKTQLNQELLNIMREKKLSPDINCLINEIEKNNAENVALILKTNIDLNRNYFTDYPIFHAVKKNNIQITKMLLDNGAKLDRGFNSELYQAVKNKNAEMAQLLIDYGAKVNYIDVLTNNSILYLSLKNNMTEITKQLIRKGVNFDNKSIYYIKKKKINLDEFNDKLN